MSTLSIFNDVTINQTSFTFPFSECGVDVETDFKEKVMAFVRMVNQHISPINLEIRKGAEEEDGQQYYVLVRTIFCCYLSDHGTNLCKIRDFFLLQPFITFLTLTYNFLIIAKNSLFTPVVANTVYQINIQEFYEILVHCF